MFFKLIIMKSLIQVFTLALMLSSCGNSFQSSDEASKLIKDSLSSKSNDYVGASAGGCLEGNELRAEGNVGGAASKSYEIHYLSSSDAKPVVVAKGLTFDANGNFKFKGELPEGLPLNLNETGGDIRVVLDGGDSFVSIYSGNCEGKERP